MGISLLICKVGMIVVLLGFLQAHTEILQVMNG